MHLFQRSAFAREIDHDSPRDGYTNVKPGFDEIVVLLPPRSVMSFDIVHKNERQVESVGSVREVIPSCPVEGARPCDGGIEPAEIAEWVEDVFIPHGEFSFRPAEA